MKVYLLGPMSGFPDFNYAAFAEAAEALRAQGMEVVSPAETDAANDWKPGEHDPLALPDEEYRRPLRWAMRAVLADDIEGGVALPGWKQSTGARLEALTLAALRLPVVTYPSSEQITPTDIALAVSGHDAACQELLVQHLAHELTELVTELPAVLTDAPAQFRERAPNVIANALSAHYEGMLCQRA